MSNIFLTAINENPDYIQKFRAFAKSMEINSPEDSIKLYFFNALPDTLAGLRAKHSNVIFVPRHIDGLEKDPRGKMVCVRTSIVKENMNKFDKISWIDVDILIRGSLKEFWNKVEEGSLFIMHRPTARKKSLFQAGVFGLGINSFVNNMITWWDAEVQKRVAWWIDQEYLYKAWNLFKDNVKLVELSQQFNDSTFKEKSIIWHSKGGIHFTDPRFQKEYQYYLKKSL